ncbi:hypothetical protein [Blastopirellula marina]|uniref:Uncharacterized protein n=1 Tax=Blastopirellula marina TaxID=124 RepID=A0A2S8GD46_9BACT|nr:hypothetical protein [Blastopirellula marina]PQO42385.1 hypothetical protein C5Y93_29065 [Blastopirellula marina]
MNSEIVSPELTFGVILGRLAISAVAWLTHLAVTLGLILFFASMVPFYRELFEVVDLQMATMTELVLHWSLGFSNYWYLLILALIVVDGPIAIGVTYLPRHFRWMTWIWFCSYPLGAFVLVLAANIGLMLGIRDITDLVNGGDI